VFLGQDKDYQHPAWLLFGLAGVNAGFSRRCRVASNVFYWRCPLVILVKDSKLLAALTKYEAAVGDNDSRLLNWSTWRIVRVPPLADLRFWESIGTIVVAG
jgi:hypothetical protein